MDHSVLVGDAIRQRPARRDDTQPCGVLGKGRRDSMNVGQVIELAREWVEADGRKTPGFHGAHLMGSLVTLPRDGPFPLWKDVDLSIVVPDGYGYESGIENQELSYEGLILEVSFHELAEYRSPEKLLSNPEYASCFAVDSILSDPTGMLQERHTAVSQHYAEREWVLARCEFEKREFWERLGVRCQVGSPVEEFLRVGRAMCYVAGIVAVAHLRQPTHRCCLILMRELLEPRGKAELCDETLRVLGYIQMSRAQVESYLQESARAFDRAVDVHRTPSPYGFKLHPHVRPYFVQAAQEMIDEGHHREAMFWICVFHFLSNAAIQNDASDEEKPQFQAIFDRLLDGLGLSTPEDWTSRVEQAKALAEEVFQVADEIVVQNPDIVD
jgi:hypothetical protein